MARVPRDRWPYPTGAKYDATLRAERILAGARVALAIAALAAIYVDPLEPTRHTALAYRLLVAYSVLSLAFFWWIRSRGLNVRLIPAVHVLDISLAAIVSSVTEGPNSPFIVLFTFVILAAAYRWGFRETVITGGVFLILFLFQVVLLGNMFVTFNGARLGTSQYVMRSVYLSLVTVLLGYLAEQDKRSKAENGFIAEILRTCQRGAILTPTVQTCLKMLGEFYRARRVLLFVQENDGGRVFRWEYPVKETHVRESGIQADFAEAAKYLFPSPVQIWCWQNLRSRGACRTLTANNGDAIFPAEFQFPPPASFAEAVSCNTVLAGTFVIGENLPGRLFLLDPSMRSSPLREMQFLRRVSEEIGPVVHNIYLWRRLRSRAHAIEQARAAREMHDGVIQVLFALEMEMQALILKTENDSAIRPHLQRLRHILREQSRELRDLMAQMRTPALTPGQLVGFLEDYARKFGHETGIRTRFVSNVATPPLPANACHELARITQEALVNIRKHSHASNVYVSLDCDGRNLSMTIEDDGQGTGLQQWCHDQPGPQKSLEPTIIKERVLLLKGNLRIEPSAVSGTRLEIRIPLSEYAEWWK